MNYEQRRLAEIRGRVLDAEMLRAAAHIAAARRGRPCCPHPPEEHDPDIGLCEHGWDTDPASACHCPGKG